jgi:hypothetical protein
MYQFINSINPLAVKPATPQVNSYSNNTMSPLIGAKTVSLFSQPYLDTVNHCYKNIVVVNIRPQGPLADFIRFVKFPSLSEFNQSSPCNNVKQCGYALLAFNGDHNCCLSKCRDGDLMTVDQIPDLISFLVSSEYSVDTSITKMFNGSDIRFDSNKLICFITYQG